MEAFPPPVRPCGNQAYLGATCVTKTGGLAQPRQQLSPVSFPAFLRGDEDGRNSVFQPKMSEKQ